MTSLSHLGVLLIISTLLIGSVGTVAAAPSDDVLFQTDGDDDFANGSNNTTNTTNETVTETEQNTTNNTNESTPTPTQNNSTNSTNNSSANASDQDGNLSDYDFVFLNGLRLVEGNHTDGMARITLENPTNETKRVIIRRSNSDEDILVRVPANGERDLTIKMNGTLKWTLTINTGISASQFDEEVGEDGTGTTSRLSYEIEHTIITANHSPDVPHPILIVFSGGVPIFLLIFGFFRKENRMTRVAVNINGPKTLQVESPDYEYNLKSNRPWIWNAVIKQIQFTKQWVAGWGLIVIPAVIFLGGVGAFFGHGLFNSDLANGVNIYMAYGELLFGLPSGVVGIWFARKNWVELNQIRTDDAGFWLWYLTPSRFAEMDVFLDISNLSEEAFDELCELVDDYKISEDGSKMYVPHAALCTAHSDSPREAYEVDEYFPYANEAKISFVNKELGVRTSELIRNDENLRKVVKKDLHVRAQLGTLRKLNEGQLIRNRLEKAVNHLVHAFQRGVIPDEEEVMDEISADTEERVDDAVDKQLRRQVENGDIDGDNLPDRYSHLNGGDN